jgi:hypothetical protein
MLALPDLPVSPEKTLNKLGFSFADPPPPGHYGGSVPSVVSLSPTATDDSYWDTRQATSRVPARRAPLDTTLTASALEQQLPTPFSRPPPPLPVARSVSFVDRLPPPAIPISRASSFNLAARPPKLKPRHDLYAGHPAQPPARADASAQAMLEAPDESVNHVYEVDQLLLDRVGSV